jgi:hypothetical protein
VVPIMRQISAPGQPLGADRRCLERPRYAPRAADNGMPRPFATCWAAPSDPTIALPWLRYVRRPCSCTVAVAPYPVVRRALQVSQLGWATFAFAFAFAFACSKPSLPPCLGRTSRPTGRTIEILRQNPR